MVDIDEKLDPPPLTNFSQMGENDNFAQLNSLKTGKAPEISARIYTIEKTAANLPAKPQYKELFGYDNTQTLTCF